MINCDNVAKTRFKKVQRMADSLGKKCEGVCVCVRERERERENTNPKNCPTYLIYRNEDTKNGVHRIAASTLFAQLIPFSLHARSRTLDPRGKKKRTAGLQASEGQE